MAVEEILEDDEYTWTTNPLSKDVKLHASLKDFESSLRCPICAQLFCNPVILTSTNSNGQCEHTFCSECIRSYFAKTRRTSAKGSGSLHCPVCRNATDERKLIPNRLVGECTLSWKAMRESLLKAMRDNAENRDAVSSKEKGNKKKRNATTEKPRASKRPRRSNRIKKFNDSDVSKDDQDEENNAESDNSDDDDYNPNTYILTNSDEKNGLKSTTKAVNSNGMKILKMKSSYHYHGMKRKQLQKLCASEQLPTHGTDKELKDRHMKFITLYNAECDSNNPRSHLDLVKVLVAREKHERDEKILALQSGATAHSSLVNKLVQSYQQVSNDVSEELKCEQQKNIPEKKNISSGNTNFDKVVQSNYRLMIDRLNQQKGGKTKQTSHKNLKIVADDSKLDVNTVNMNSKKISTQGELVISSSSSSSPTQKPNISPITHVEKSISPTQPQHKSPIHQRLPSSTTQQQSTQSIKKSNNTIPSVVGPWVCSKCTFRNTTRTWSNAKCEICLAKRPSPTTLSILSYSRNNLKTDEKNGNDNENSSSEGNGVITIDV